MLRRTTTWVMLIVMVIATGAVVRWLRTEMSVAEYRQKLQALGHRYEQLRETYNEAVTRTAVTELVVDQGHLFVVVRTIQGVTQKIETPFDPYGEVYVDYVVIDGRLLIRRVFDAMIRSARLSICLDDLISMPPSPEGR